jgi:hypothetical protein
MRLVAPILVLAALLGGCPADAPTVTPADPTPSGDTMPVPDDLVEAMKADVVDRTGVDPATIDVARAEAVTWSDGSLGCPEPGMFYTQALVDGYHVVLEADGVEHDYRADDRGNFRLCKNPVDGGSGLVDR